MRSFFKREASRTRRERRTLNSLCVIGIALLVLVLTHAAPLTRTACATEVPEKAPGSGPLELTEREAEAEAVRELKFKEALTYKPLKADELVRFLENEIREQYGKDQLQNLLLAYEKLGLIKSADGLVELLVQAYASEIMAFYDHRTDTVHMIEDPTLPRALQQVTELHELIHALQDQHFDLGTLPIEDVHHTDRANAAMALVEGDATLATFQYAAEHMRFSFGDSMRIVSRAFQPGPAAPYLFRREMSFIYFDGLELARALHTKGGWAALNKAFADPPASTEQVLHYKHKYLDERDAPTPVELPDCTPILGEGWTRVAEDVLGELYTQVLFRQHLSFLRAGKPSRGWDGDRLHLYRAGDETVLIWRTVWDTEKDAEEFAEAYRKVLLRKFRTSDKNVTQDPLGLVVQGETATAILHTSECDVLTVEAPSETIARAVTEHIRAGDANTEHQTAEEALEAQ